MLDKNSGYLANREMALGNKSEGVGQASQGKDLIKGFSGQDVPHTARDPLRSPVALASYAV